MYRVMYVKNVTSIPRFIRWAFLPTITYLLLHDMYKVDPIGPTRYSLLLYYSFFICYQFSKKRKGHKIYNSF